MATSFPSRMSRPMRDRQGLSQISFHPYYAPDSGCCQDESYTGDVKQLFAPQRGLQLMLLEVTWSSDKCRAG